MFDDVTGDVILRHVGGLLGDVLPINLTERLYIIIEYIRKFEIVSEGGSEGGLEPSRVTGYYNIKNSLGLLLYLRTFSY